ncbi:hypothetical protein [Microbacterium sp.]|uniref:hypothetical protein n=1 Tax=Microbacterium sp. TaxID=51671 RepID=UPI003C742405
MSTVTTTSPAPPLARTLRVAGIAGILHGALHIAWILLNQLVLMPSTEEGALTTPAAMQDEFVMTTLVAVVFVAAGVLSIVSAGGVAALVRARGSVLAPTAAALGASFGIVMIAVSAASAAIRGFPNEYIAATGAPESTQAAVIEGMFAVPQSMTFLAALLFAAWCVVTAIARVYPVWLLVVNVVVALVVTGLLFVAGAAGMMLSTIYFIVLGIWLVRAARRA